jgi:hypothetical protein
VRLESTIAAVAVPLLCIALAESTSATGTVAGLRPAERCTGAVMVSDARYDTRSWTAPPRLPETNPAYGDLRSFEIKSTSAGVCVRWTTAAPAALGATFVLFTHGPYVREAGGAIGTNSYGFELRLSATGAVATDLDHRYGPRVLRVRAGQTGTVVSAFVPRAELNRRQPNAPDRPPFPYNAFTIETRLLTAPDPRGNMRVDFWPQEGGQGEAAYINGHLCAKPCRDKRFNVG